MSEIQNYFKRKHVSELTSLLLNKCAYFRKNTRKRKRVLNVN